MNARLGKVLGFHQALWTFDPWYRRACLIAPQALSIALVVVMLPGGETPAPPAAPWVKPQTPPTAANPDHPLCMNVGDAKQRGEACDRLIKSGRLTGLELADAHFGRGLMRQVTNQPDLAIADYTEAVRLNPRHSVAYTSRGGQYLSKNELANAEKDFETAIETSGNNNSALALALAFKADLRRKQGRLSEAQKEIARALEVQKDFPYGQTVRDNIEADVKRAQEATRKPPPQTQPPPRSDPSAALRSRAHADLQKNDYDIAIAQFTELILGGSRDPGDFDGRGTAYSAKQQFDLAMADFTQAIGLNGHTWYPHFKRAEIYMGRGELDRALADLNAAIGDHAGNEARIFHQRGRVHLRKQNYSLAVADFDKVVQLAPNFAEGYLLRAQASANDTRALSEACRKSQANQSTSTMIGGPCSIRISFDSALADLRTAVAKKPELADAHYETGRILYELNRWQDAVDAFSEAIRVRPNHSYAYNNRGICYMKLNRRDRAMADFTDAIRTDPRNKEALTNRAEMYEGSGQRRQAIDDFRSALNVDPQYAPAVAGMRRLGSRR